MIYTARHAIGKPVRGQALAAHDGFSARYDLDRARGVFSRPTHKLAGQSYVGRILVLDTAKGGVASAWMLHEMAARAVEVGARGEAVVCHQRLPSHGFADRMARGVDHRRPFSAASTQRSIEASSGT